MKLKIKHIGTRQLRRGYSMQFYSEAWVPKNYVKAALKLFSSG